MLRTSMVSLGLAAALFAAPAALAQTPPPPPPPGATTQAMPFVKTAGASDLYEIESSRVALRKTRSAEVRELATMLIRHHTKTSADTMAAALAARVKPPKPMLMPEHRAQIAELNAASAADFDRVYLAQQLPAHQAALALMQGYASGGDKPQLRKAATGAVPIIQSHIDRINQLQAR